MSIKITSTVKNFDDVFSRMHNMVSSVFQEKFCRHLYKNDELESFLHDCLANYKSHDVALDLVR